jgi:hypothetical protein
MSTKSLFEHIHKNLPPLSECRLKGIIVTFDDDGKFHSINDEPAVITVGGIKAWFKNGALHRSTVDPQTNITLPAFVKKGPSTNEKLEEWWINDEQHREDIDPKTGKSMPAEIFLSADSSYKCWRRNGKIHRDQNEGPAYINRFSQCFLENGVPHRDNDLPAVISTDGREMEWWHKGKRDRKTLDTKGNLLPAIIRANNTKEYWVDGNKIDIPTK